MRKSLTQPSYNKTDTHGTIDTLFSEVQYDNGGRKDLLRTHTLRNSLLRYSMLVRLDRSFLLYSLMQTSCGIFSFFILLPSPLLSLGPLECKSFDRFLSLSLFVPLFLFVVCILTFTLSYHKNFGFFLKVQTTIYDFVICISI